MAWGKYARYDRFFRNIDNKWRDYGSASDVDRYKYGYDQASNRTYRENTKSGSKDELYTYDGLHRLKNFDRGNLNGSYDGMTGTIAKEFDWDLDATGNWESLTQKTSGSTDFTQNRDHNEVNEVTSADDAGGSSSGPGNWVDPAYDNNGNMTTLPRPASLSNSYTGVYDAWNRLVEVKIGSTVKQANEYDGLHRRIIRDESNGSGDVRHFYYSQQWQVLEERVGTSTDAKCQYIYGPQYVDEIVLRERDTNDNGTLDERLYYLQDANFNVTALVNTSGDAQERYLYDPYGEVTIMDGSWGSRSSSLYDNEMLFTGRRVDPETGLQLNRYRFHHQQLGRWVTRDPLRYHGNMWNLHEYCDGKPATRLDGWGLFPYMPPAPPSTQGKCGQCPNEESYNKLEQCCESGTVVSKVTIWQCFRRLGGYSFISYALPYHMFLCCDGPNKNCYGHEDNDLKKGDPIPADGPEAGRGVGDCRPVKVCPEVRERKCKNPVCPRDAGTLTWNCRDWSNSLGEFPLYPHDF